MAVKNWFSDSLESMAIRDHLAISPAPKDRLDSCHKVQLLRGKDLNTRDSKSGMREIRAFYL